MSVQIFDAHTHLSGSVLPQVEGYYQLATASTYAECERLEAMATKHPRLYCAYGLHPWHSDSQALEELLPFFEKGSAIGEIGMDSLWCDVDLQRQESIFRTQLALAEHLKKPIVLHTKGCEKEVLEAIQGFSQPILVHWYSAQEYLQGYIDKGCYFTVGPDCATNLAVQALVHAVPKERLMLESDGVGGLSWVLGRRVGFWEIPALLEALLLEVGRQKSMKPDILAKVLFQNVQTFLNQT